MTTIPKAVCRFVAVLYVIAVATIAGCSSDDSDGNPSGPTPVGTIRVVTTTTGSGTDTDGYTVTVLQVTKPIATNDAVLFENVAPGDYSVSLDDIDTGCAVSGTNPRTGVVVTDGNTTVVNFNIVCTASGSFGEMEVKVITSGSNPDDQYLVEVDGTDSTAVNVGATLPDTAVVTITDTVGVHHVRLVGLTSNCNVTTTNPQSILVEENGTTPVLFEVGCSGASIPNEIVFVRHDPQGISQVWVCDALGENQTQLTFGGEDKALPRWSPDGAEIIVNTSDQTASVYGVVLRMNADGSNQYPVTFPAGFEPGPADWSPNGNAIALSGTENGGPSSYYTYDFDTLSLPLLDNPSSLYSNWSMPFWSPDGTKLIFSIQPPGGSGTSVEAIMTLPVTLQAGIPKQVVTDPSDAWGYLYPQWSPDGSQIVFLGPGPGRSIWIVDADGSNPHEVIDPPFGAEQPTWLPAIYGNRIGFQQVSQVGLFTVNADGTDLSSIGVGPNALFGQPHWNPKPELP
jgi:dipeptidyl aminopeptidase/acylaminoacyl peptidase